MEKKKEMGKTKTETGKTKTEKKKEEPKIIELRFDKITSGKLTNSIFSITYKGKIWENPILPKQSPNQFYNYSHTINPDIIQKINKKFPESGLWEFGGENTPEEYKRITIESYGKIMRYRLWKFIMKTFDNRIFEKNGKTYQLRIIWEGNEMKEPSMNELKEIKEKKEKPQKEDKNKILEGIIEF